MTGFDLARGSAVAQVAVPAGYNLGVVLGELERSGEAIEVYDQVLARFGDAIEPVLREAVDWALSARRQAEE